MSNFYRISIEIRRHDSAKSDSIKDAAASEWSFEDWYEREGKLTCCAESFLGAGESEKEFAERVSVAVWRANGKFCDVSVHATYLEDLPCETFSFDESDFERLKAEIENGADDSSATKPN